MHKLNMYNNVMFHCLPEEVGLLFPLFLCTRQEIKGCPCGGVGKVEPSTCQQFPYILHQFEVGPGAQGSKGCLCDTEHFCIPELEQK